MEERACRPSLKLFFGKVPNTPLIPHKRLSCGQRSISFLLNQPHKLSVNASVSIHSVRIMLEGSQGYLVQPTSFVNNRASSDHTRPWPYYFMSQMIKQRHLWLLSVSPDVPRHVCCQFGSIFFNPLWICTLTSSLARQRLKRALKMIVDPLIWSAGYLPGSRTLHVHVNGLSLMVSE